MTPRRRRGGAPAWALALLIAACGSGAASTPEAVDTPGVAVFGIGPEPDSSVAYQADVVVVGGGAAAIRSASGDGLRWTIDGAAPGASDLERGDVMFVTSTAVGRVVAIDDTGGDRVVTLGPVDITDIVRDGRFEVNQGIELDALAHQVLPALPGALDLTENDDVRDPEAAETSATGLRVVAPALTLVATQPEPTWGSPPDEVTSELTIGDFSIELSRPKGSSGQIDLKGKYSKDGVVVGVGFTLAFDNPSVDLVLDIAAGRIREARARITGIREIGMAVDAGSAAGLGGNFKALLEVPIDSTYPFMAGPVPMNLSIRHKLLVETAFTAKDSTLTASGTYAIDGPFGFEAVGSTVTLIEPTVTATRAMIDTLDGVSIGVNGIVVGYSAKVGVGVGPPLFSAGPFGAITVSAGLTNGSDLGIVKCRQASRDVLLSGGLGFTVGGGDRGGDVVRSLLARLRSKAKLESDLGVQTVSLVHERTVKPKVAACM